MEMTSRVMRFALATYFMKRGGGSRPSQSFDASSWSSPTYKPSVSASDEDEQQEVEEDANSEFSDVVSAHVSNLRQLLVEQRFQEWSSGIAYLREYVTDNELLGSLVAQLVQMLKKQEQDAVCIVQVIEHMCFENSGGPSGVFDQMVELLSEALRLCCEGKDVADVGVWLVRALDGINHGLHQYHEQQYGMASGSGHKFTVQKLEEMIHEIIREGLSSTQRD